MKGSSLLIIPLILIASLVTAAEQKYKLKDIPTDEEKARMEKSQPADTGMGAGSKTELANEVAEEFYQLGMKALNTGNLDQAEGYFDRALILRPNFDAAKDGIEYIMQAYEKSSDKKSLVDPKAELVKKLYSELEKEFSDNNFEKAGSLATKILAIDPQHQGAKQKLIAINKNLFEEAIERADEREQAEDYQGAIDALQVAFGYRKDSSLRPRIDELRAKIYEQKIKKSDRLYVEALSANQTGNTEDALKLCKRALAYNPNNLQAKRMLERLSAKAP